MPVRWECERCGRTFGRTGQGHTCVPGMTVDAYFDGRPSVQRAIYDAVAEHMTSLGPMEIEAVGVGVFFKKARTFVELRGRQKWMNLSFMLDHRVDAERVGYIGGGGGRHFHRVRLDGPQDVDDELRSWLTASYVCAPD
ncbi:MAG: DUF5655 domain-containing protein [Dehalococcoidia bacterium]